jgi:predicted small lipoprotein YifL
MRFHRLTSTLMLFGALASCATIAPLEYPPDHPANPGAGTVPFASHPGALGSYRAAGDRAPPAERPADEQEQPHGGGHAH